MSLVPPSSWRNVQTPAGALTPDPRPTDSASGAQTTLEPPPPISVRVVCRDPSDHELLRRVRELVHIHLGKTFSSQIDSVSRVTPDDVATLRDHPSATVLICPEAMGSAALDAVHGLPNVYAILCARSSERAEYPCASHSRLHTFVLSNHLIDAVRKAVISLGSRRLVIRPILTPADFEAYFHLRFVVWQQLDYIPAGRVSEATKWEVGYTDRTSFPIGAFANGALIGCARLVMPFGAETPAAQVIRDLIVKRGDPVLAKNFEYPRFLSHPFDMLQSFRAFQTYYHELVIRGLRKAEVSRVIVAPDHRRCGVGELLVDTIVSLALGHQIHRLFLACADVNAPLYRRCGFTALEGMRTDRFVNVNAPAMAMERVLGAAR